MNINKKLTKSTNSNLIAMLTIILLSPPPPSTCGTNKGLPFKTRLHLKRGVIDMNISMTGQEKGDCLIEVTSWADLTVVVLCWDNSMLSD